MDARTGAMLEVRLFLVLVSALPAGCGAGEPSDSSGLASGPQRGRDVYRARCDWCHGTGMFGSPRLSDSLASARARVESFAEHAAALEVDDPERYRSNRDSIAAILALPPGPDRFESWLGAYVNDPGFDRTTNRMQRVPLDLEETAALAAYLATLP